MKKIFTSIIIVMALLAVVAVSMFSCGSSPVENAIVQAFNTGDTTQTRFDSICSIITQSPEKYSHLLTDDGYVDTDALGKLIESIGSKRRPPAHWDISGYGQHALTLTVYFERSGSMVPYDSKGGSGQLKKAVDDLINEFPSANVEIKVVNDGIYDYSHSVNEFLKDRDIYGSTAGVGNPKYTDFQKIFTSILTANRPGNISVVVTDMIYSPANTKDVSVEKILNEENSIAHNIFKQNSGKSVIVHRLTGDYDGKYYPYNNNPVNYKGKRPFFLVVIGNEADLDFAAASPEYKALIHPAGTTHSYRFNQSQSKLKYCVVPGWKTDAGRYRPSHKQDNLLEKCEPDKKSDQFSFSIAVNLSPLQKSADFLVDLSNYTLRCQSEFVLTIAPITDDIITGNNRKYFEGKTHLLTLAGKLANSRDEVTITLRNDFPEWIAQCSTKDDTRPDGNTTFGLEQWLSGMQAGFGTADNYATIKVKLQR